MAEMLTFPVTAEVIVRLEAADLFERAPRSRINRLRAIDKAAIHGAVASGAPLAEAMEIADRHLARIKTRLEALEQIAAFGTEPIHKIAAGGRS
ncbi:hypothetical protein [Aquamicrobium ahrensii]|uniref:Uncharacterized protein n=1 Tax=Aquamicrobium ahrensii TaxID=469551 RepID=A0ABV2KH99_9HYPH